MGRILIVILTLLMPFGSVYAAPKHSKPAKTTLIAPHIEAVMGLSLARNGAEGLLDITQTGSEAAIKRLILPGSRLDRPTQACNVEIKSVPIKLENIGAPEGMTRYKADVANCPFVFDVLDGAVLVTMKTCAITAAQCHIDAGGLWGPPALRMTSQRILQSEDRRMAADVAARMALRRLIELKPDPDLLKEIIRQHVAFKVDRDQQCRDYDGESRIGFCAARLTEAHAFALGAQYERTLEADKIHKAQILEEKHHRALMRKQHQQRLKHHAE